jgi:hypothetical protein
MKVILLPWNDFTRIPPPRQFTEGRAPTTATFSINYLSSGPDGQGATCLPWNSSAQTAFTYAANVWGTLINSSVPIRINACWANLGDPNLLGYSWSNLTRDFSGAPVAGTYYSYALADALAGTNLDPSKPDTYITYNNGMSWYFGTDGNTPAGQADFVSVVMHEMGHSLNFAGSMNYGATACGGVASGCWGYSGYPSIYDRFTENGSGQSLINTSFFGNPSPALGTQLTGGNLYFNGTNANAANGGRVKIYAPSAWKGGSSYSHLDYTTFAGTANRLMVYMLTSGTSIHSPGPVSMGLLKDLGWNPSAPGTNKVHLPLMVKAPASTSTPTPTTQPSGPTAGYWQTSTGSHEFYVTPDRAYVRNHAVYILINGGPCNGQTWQIKNLNSVTISSNHYSFNVGGFYVTDGNFTSSTTATVTDGLNNVHVFDTTIDCGYITGGPWTRDYTWKNSTQPTMPVYAVESIAAEPMTVPEGAYEVVPVK